MASKKRTFGDIGERIAEKFLITKGYRVIERNYRKSWGEIDLIARKGSILICCEVKTRRHRQNTIGAPPEQSVDRKKSAKLRKLCEAYVAEQHMLASCDWRIDVLAVVFDPDRSKAWVRHIENAVWGA